MTKLTEWDALRVAIKTATNLPDVKTFRDKAEALKHYLKVSGEAEEVVRRFSELKVRAERKGGELLLVMPKQTPGQWQRRTDDAVATYAELGIDRGMASKWQRIA